MKLNYMYHRVRIINMWWIRSDKWVFSGKYLNRVDLWLKKHYAEQTESLLGWRKTTYMYRGVILQQAPSITYKENK